MLKAANFKFPPEKRKQWKKASRYEWMTLLYLTTSVIMMYLVLGNSQAMKAAWLESLMAMVPAMAFLISSKFESLQSSSTFPYGFHRMVSAGFLIGSVALLIVGLYILYDSISGLATGAHPTIGSIRLFDQMIWLGWPMIAVLAYDGILASIFGRLKLPLASELHDKQLYVDARMLKADWMTDAAAIIGILGIGMGFWWADAAAAIVIGVDVVKDGILNTRRAFCDLLDSTPVRTDRSGVDPAVGKVIERLKHYDWIEDCEVRMREEGRLIVGQAFVVPRAGTTDLVGKLDDLTHDVEAMCWNIHEFVTSPVRQIPEHLRDEDPPLEHVGLAQKEKEQRKQKAKNAFGRAGRWIEQHSPF